MVRNNFPISEQNAVLPDGFLKKQAEFVKSSNEHTDELHARHELMMKRLYATLSEKDRRRYAAIEAAKLGISAISSLFGLDVKTVRRGLTELALPVDPAPSRVRKKAVDASS